MRENVDVPTCRVCGCTDDYGCPSGCYWVEDDLCSSCATPEQLDEFHLNLNEHLAEIEAALKGEAK